MRFCFAAATVVWTLLASPALFAQGAPPMPSAPTAPDPPIQPAVSPEDSSEPAPETPPVPVPPAASSEPAPTAGDPAFPEKPSPAQPSRPPALAAEKPAPSDAPAQQAPLVADAGEKPFPRERFNLPFTLEGRGGFVARLSESAGAFDQEQVFGGAFGIGGWIEPSEEFAFGVELDHTGLGNARDLSGLNSLDAEYSVTSAWLGTRVFPIRKKSADVFVALRVGLGWQSLSATGTRDRLPTTAPAEVFSCSEAEGPGFSLGGGIGLNLRVSRRVSFVPRIDFSGQQLSGEVLGSCAVGIGSVTAAALTLGVGYDFELEPG